LLTYFVN